MQTGTWYKTDGTQERVMPKEGKTFTLEELQGMVEGVGMNGEKSTTITEVRFPDGRRVIANDNGKLIGLPVNEKASEEWRAQFPIEKYPENNDGILVGNVLVIDRTGPALLKELEKVGFAEGAELIDDDGEIRYLLEIADGEWHLTGNTTLCMCESWYTFEEIEERGFYFTGEVKDLQDLEEFETKCNCETLE